MTSVDVAFSRTSMDGSNDMFVVVEAKSCELWWRVWCNDAVGLVNADALESSNSIMVAEEIAALEGSIIVVVVVGGVQASVED